jgi:hypothetical protein
MKFDTFVFVETIQSKEEEEKKNETVLSIREALISKKTDFREPEHDSENDDSPEDENEEDFDNRMRSRILKKRRELGDTRPSENSKKGSLLLQFLNILLRQSFSISGTLLSSNLLYHD